ncbi:hypothetical protein G9C98_007224, partial [Cotesia typhae]
PVNDLRQTLPSLLTEKTAEELENLPPYVEKCIMVYIPDIQHCLAITEWNGPPPDDEMIPGLEFKFSCNNIRVKHIAQLANEQKFKIDMQEFKQWILQAIKRR